MPPDPLEACVLWALAWVPLAPNRLHFPYDLLPKNTLRRLQNSPQAFFQIILDCHISNFSFLPDFVEPISYQIIFHLVSVLYITLLVIKYWKYSSL